MRSAVTSRILMALFLAGSICGMPRPCVSGSALGAAEPAGIPPHLAPLLPTPAQLRGWTIDEGPVAYTPENLYEILDGGAERYLGYGFRALAHARYCLRSASQACVTLDIFDMGSALGAFGIYRSALTSSAVQRPWGAEGSRNGTLASGWKDAIFVHAEADDDRPALIALLESLTAAALAAGPPGSSGSEGGAPSTHGRDLPAILDPLPEDGRVPLSERYVAGDLLGFSFLPGGVLAEYELGDARAELFFSDTGSDSAAIAALDRLRAHHGKRGSLVRGLPDGVGPGLRYHDAVQGSGTIAAHGRYVTGVHGALPYPEQEKLLAQLHERLEGIEPAR